jgi:hypothetical protein
MSKEFKPNYLLDEQMYFDAEKTLLHQIREEQKETNRLLRLLVEQKVEQTEVTHDNIPLIPAGETVVPLEDLGITALKKEAKERQIEGYTTLEKEELIAAIKKHDEENAQ